MTVNQAIEAVRRCAEMRRNCRARHRSAKPTLLKAGTARVQNGELQGYQLNGTPYAFSVAFLDGIDPA